jgi:hypothetical protein
MFVREGGGGGEKAAKLYNSLPLHVVSGRRVVWYVASAAVDHLNTWVDPLLTAINTLDPLLRRVTSK